MIPRSPRIYLSNAPPTDLALQSGFLTRSRMTVEENPLVAISELWDRERTRRHHKLALIVLQESDLDQIPRLSIVKTRLFEIMENILMDIHSLSSQNLSYLSVRDNCQAAVVNIHQCLSDVRGLDLFHPETQPLEILLRVIEALVEVLCFHVYVSCQHTSLIDNEWIMIQNDLSLMIKLAELVPCAAAQIGKSFGYL